MSLAFCFFIADTSSQYVKAELDFIADFCELAAKLLAFFAPFKDEKDQVILSDRRFVRFGKTTFLP